MGSARWRGQGSVGLVALTLGLVVGCEARAEHSARVIAAQVGRARSLGVLEREPAVAALEAHACSRGLACELRDVCAQAFRSQAAITGELDALTERTRGTELTSPQRAAALERLTWLEQQQRVADRLAERCAALEAQASRGG